jgi:hypothetical protein
MARTKFHLAVSLGEQGVVTAPADIDPGVEMGAALTHHDRPSADRRSIENLHAEALSVRIAAVAGRAPAFGL